MYRDVYALQVFSTADRFLFDSQMNCVNVFRVRGRKIKANSLVSYFPSTSREGFICYLIDWGFALMHSEIVTLETLTGITACTVLQPVV